MTAARQENPIASTIAVNSDQRVERSDRNFVHSERTTRSCVTRSWDDQAEAAGAVVTGRPPPVRSRARQCPTEGIRLHRSRLPLMWTSSRTRGGVDVEVEGRPSRELRASLPSPR